MAYCKKHGDIGNRTLEFNLPLQIVISTRKGKVSLPPEDEKAIFCLDCLIDFLRKKIGECKP